MGTLWQALGAGLLTAALCGSAHAACPAADPCCNPSTDRECFDGSMNHFCCAKQATCTGVGAYKTGGPVATCVVDNMPRVGTCSAGWMNCDGNAANGCERQTEVDPFNCGACGNACTQHRACVSGTCTAATCLGNFANCDGDAANGCETDLTSPAFCGGCATACSTNNITPACDYVVSAWECTGTCTGTFGDCDLDKRTNGCETDLSSDPNNCNGCGTKCSDQYPNATGLGCSGGVCTYGGCTAPYAHCGASASTGCETNTNTDDAHCGSCGISCATQVKNTVSAGTCDGAGACTYTGECAPGFGDCDGNKANGCETNLKTSVAHCNACNNACTAPVGGTPTCTLGVCDFTCSKKRCGDVCAACCGDVDCPLDPTNKCKDPSCSAPGTAGAACGFTLKVCVQKECFTSVLCNPNNGECESNPQTGGECGANGCCEPPGSKGTCTAGVCGCTLKDCSTGVPVCQVGICDAVGGGCATEGQVNGTPCTSADKCVEAAQCQGGACVGTPKVCTTTNQCRVAGCNAGTGACDETLATVGTPCTLGNSCVQNEACNAAGDCVGSVLPDSTPCAVADCPSGGICMLGTCTCPPSADLGASPPDQSSAATMDLLGAPSGDLAKANGADKSGCSTVGSSSPLEGALCLALALLVIAARRRSTGR